MLLVAQTNLVPNHDFNKLAKKIKEKGQINAASPWISPTLTQADLYVKNTKSTEIGAANNTYGGETPMKGDNFAGILAYSPKGKIPRSYLQVKLTESLKEDIEYCVTFHVSLADLSKFSCNYLGAYLSAEAVSANNNDILQFEPQVVSRRFTVYEQQFDWIPICAKFKAKGGEEYITIGNFTPESKLKIGKVKRPQGYNSPQSNDAYYFVDNVIVSPLNVDEKCDCDFIPGVDDVEISNKNFKSDVTTQPNNMKFIDSDGKASSLEDKSLANDFTLFFEVKKMDINNSSIAKLDNLIAYLKLNIKDKVSIEGYIDSAEKGEEKLDGKRAGAVYKYIVSKGIPKEQIINSMKGIAEDKDSSKNMKVEIHIQKFDSGNK